MVERPAVNRKVAGSIPASGDALIFQERACSCGSHDIYNNINVYNKFMADSMYGMGLAKMMEGRFNAKFIDKKPWEFRGILIGIKR